MFKLINKKRFIVAYKHAEYGIITIKVKLQILVL